MRTLQLELQETGILGRVKSVHTKLTRTINQAMEHGYTVDQILDAFELPGSEHFADFVAMTIDDMIWEELAAMSLKPPKRFSPAKRMRKLARR